MSKKKRPITITVDKDMLPVIGILTKELKKRNITIRVRKKKKKRANKSSRVAFVSTKRMLPMANHSLNVMKKHGKPGKFDGIQIHEINFTRFACGEMKPKILKNVRKKEVFLFFDFNGDINDDIVNLLLSIEALHLADARRITLVLPFMPYLRQDRKDEPRTPVSAAWFIRALQMCDSVRRVITVDMHSDQLQAVFTIPTDHLPGRLLFAPWAKQKFKGRYHKLVAVSPDFGSAKRVRKLAKEISPKVGVAILEKNRNADDVEILSTIGASVKGKICLINDDMMDSCGTIIEAALALYAQGAKMVILSATHPIFSSTTKVVPKLKKNGEPKLKQNGTPKTKVVEYTAYEKLAEAGVKVLVSDSLLTEEHSWLEILSLGDLIGMTILCNLTGGSVSKLIRKGRLRR